MKNNFLHFTFYLTIIFFCQSSLLFAQESKKPNILFIAVDDLKPILGCYGDPLVKTPNIDRLASRATIFMSNYVQQAVCGPTRASLMTGKRPDYTQVWDLKTRMRDINPAILSLPQYLKENGYSTQGIGKVYDSDVLTKILINHPGAFLITKSIINIMVFTENLPKAGISYQKQR